MKNNFFIIIFVLLNCFVYGQVPEKVKKKIDELGERNRSVSDSTKTEENKAKITDYLIVSHRNDTTFVDTTLTIKKDYKFNYLRKDNFGLIPFSNLGQTYNTLSYTFGDNNLMPLFAARSKHFNYMEVEDINYYHVPTPLTELFYRTAFQQGHLLDAFFTVNTSKQFNFSIAYKGMRSLGKYQHILTSTGNFRVTTNYKTKNKKYNLKAHIVMQDILNEENGGVRDDNIEYFETGNPEFLDRAILDVNFENAEGLLKGKRFHVDHTYNIIAPDTISSNRIDISHIISFRDKYYQFKQTSQNDYFGDAFRSSSLRDGVTLEDLYNQLQLTYSNNILGKVQFNVSHNNYNYGYDKVVVLNNNSITNRLKGNIFSVGGTYEKKFNHFELNGELGLNVSGAFDGNFIQGRVLFRISDDIKASAQIKHLSKAPNYNFLLYQSDYINYNWQNDFDNIETQQLSFNLTSDNLANVYLDFTTISNYAYFKKDETNNLVRPFQNNKTINYLKLKLEKEFRMGKFALNNTILYQSVKDENETLNVPELIIRNTLYYSNHFFKNNALYLQTGVTFNYFTKYNMNAYDPLLSEFYVQTEKEYGAFPRLDFFVNAKVRQTRIYLKAEHVNSAWTGYNFYSAPNYPYRDFTIRFGLVWNFFL